MSQAIPHELALSIERILDRQNEGEDRDPLDSLTAEPDIAELLNQYFPDEASLVKIDSVTEELKATQHLLETEISTLYAQLKESQDPTRMQLIQEMISDLLGQMSLIREKATESEAVVRNITKDIQSLDLAKKNLTASMTTMRRLQMLVKALSQLEDFVKEKNYPEIAQSLGAVKQLCTAFKPNTGVQRIAQIYQRVQQIQGELRTTIDADFDAYYMQDPAKPMKSSTITAACGVIDALGTDLRTQFIDRYVGLELKDYRRIFRVAEANEAGGLDNISRRFAWFRRLLQTHDVEAGRVFPKEWRVEWWLFAKFLEITRDDFAILLSKAKSTLTVKLLLDNLTETKEFEQSIASKFGLPLSEICKATSTPVKAVKTISSAFEPHMGVYIEAQDKALADMLATHRAVKSRTSIDSASTAEEGTAAPLVVLPSSTELFYFYAQSIESLSQLANGADQVIIDLAKVHRKWLKVYADEVLVNSLKKPPPSNQPRKSMDTRLDIHELKNACLILNTADYCARTTEQLQSKLAEKVSQDAEASTSFQTEYDYFVSIISAAILVILRELENSLDAATSALGRTNWTTLKHVSGPSAFMADLEYALDTFADLVKPLIEQKKYLRNMFDKASGLIIARFTNALVKSRPLKEIGAEQLLIDLQNLSSSLLGLPGEELTTAGYTRNVTKGIKNLEALLKVIVIPVDTPEGFILNYTLQIGDASFTNFQKVLDLKGIPKSEENALLDSFLTITSTRDDLPTTSFLSSLDMNPPTTSLLSGTSTPLAGNVAGGTTGRGEVGAALRAALGSPPLTGTNTPDGTQGAEGKREVFSDLKRFVSFGLRRETAPAGSVQ